MVRIPVSSVRRIRAVLVVPSLLAVLTAGLAAPLSAQPEGSSSPKASSPPPAPTDARGRETPRSAMLGYLVACRDGNFERAAEYLELDSLDPETLSPGGPELARRLKAVLDRDLWVDLDALSDDPAGDVADGQPLRDRVGVISTPEAQFDVLLRRSEPPGGEPIWRVAAVTVARASAAYEQFGIPVLERFLPGAFFEIRVLEVLLWQWVAILMLAIVAWYFSWLLVVTIVRSLRPLLARTETRFDDQLLELAVPPLRLIVAIVIAGIGIRSLGLAVPAVRFATSVLQTAALVAVVWALLRFVDLAAGLIEGRLRERGDVGATSLVTPGRRTIKAVVGIIAFIAVLDNFGFDVAALIAGLGVGGIAVGLAAQKTVENLFGGITLYADRPVQVGDFFRWGDKVGTVEEIGLRSTRVRTLDRTIVTVPNAEFAGTQLENFAKRDRIRLYTTIGVRYETTPEQLRYILVEVRRLLYSHEKVLPEPARIRFVGFGAYSLDLEIFAYVGTADWNEFLGVREDLYLRIMDIVDASGSGFAFPSQTLYLGRDDAPDPERVERIEAEVRAWRERDEIFLPDFPAEKIAELDDTIRYPAEGSPARVRA